MINLTNSLFWFRDLFGFSNFEQVSHFAQENGIDIRFPYRDEHDHPALKRLMVLDYNQIEAKGSNPISNLCRGLVLDADTFEVVSRPFHRFFNYQEQNSDLLLLDRMSCHTDTIQIFDKLDGSLIKLFYHYPTEQWMIGTRAGRGENNMSRGAYSYLQAFVDIISGKNTYTHEELFNFQTRKMIPFDEIEQASVKLQQFAQDEVLDKSCTYLFELCTPFNHNVVHYSNSILSLLGVNRNNLDSTYIEKCLGLDMPNVFLSGNRESKTEMLRQFFEYELAAGVASFQHQFKCQHITYPTRFDMQSNDIEEVLGAVKMMKGREQEGFVIHLNGIPKVKVKSAEYVTIHHAISNHVFTANNAISIVMTHEEEEYLALVPERAEMLKPYIDVRDFGQQLAQELYVKLLNHFKDDDRLLSQLPSGELGFNDYDHQYNYEQVFAKANMKKEFFVFLKDNAPTSGVQSIAHNMLKGSPYHAVVSDMLTAPKRCRTYFDELFKFKNLDMADFEIRN